MTTTTDLSPRALVVLEDLDITVQDVRDGIVYCGDAQSGPYDDPRPTVAAVEAGVVAADGCIGGTLAERFAAFHDAMARVASQ